jgi:hypothetical protein
MADGDHNVICDASGFKCLKSETKKQWNGLRVRKDFWEPRNPQDRLIIAEDDQSVYDPRPEQEDVFLNPGDVSPSDL